MKIKEASIQPFHHILDEDGTNYYRFAPDIWEMTKDGKICPAPNRPELEEIFQKYIQEHSDLLITDPTKLTLEDIGDASTATEINAHTTIAIGVHLLLALYKEVLIDREAYELVKAIGAALGKSGRRAMDAKHWAMIQMRCEMKAKAKVPEMKAKDKFFANAKRKR